MQSQQLVLLHLCDIHFFERRLNGTWDLDADVRNELERDAGEVVKTLGSVDALLVTGDIALAGSKAEYETARKWLAKLCTIVRCRPENVWVVPGNHDVDRNVITGSAALREFHSGLRSCDASRIDRKLEELLEDETAGPTLIKPFENYNQFARGFECQFDSNQLHWEHDLILNASLVLRLRGINSALVSTQQDDNGSNKLIIGSPQFTMPRETGVFYLVLCHHPLDWIVDYERMEQMLNSRATLQLFGHKHSQGITQINGCVRLAAGAVHPAREDCNWKPTYNFLTLQGEMRNHNPELHLRIWCREWDDSTTKFGPKHYEGRVFYECIIPLKDKGITNQAGSIEQAVAESREETSHTAVEVPVTDTKAPSVSSKRKLIFQFFSLPFQERMAIAVKLELLSEGDESLNEEELFKKVLVRVRERNLIDTFQAEVTARTSGSE